MSAIIESSDAAARRFDGRVFHVHCDPLITPETLETGFPSTGENQFGCFTPDIFLVISSADLMANVQHQLQNHQGGNYKAESCTIQLGDSEGALGSEMISENLSSRLVQTLNSLRAKACEAFRTQFNVTSPATAPNVALAPTAAGMRLYPKLPEVKGKPEETAAKVRELAIKYGAIPGDDGETRDVSKHDVTIKVNIFGFYRGNFYLNYRLVAPFRHKDKPEILAEKKVARKRPATTRKKAEGEDAESTPAKRPRVQNTKPAKKAASSDGDADAAGEVDPENYTNEDDLATAYLRAGMNFRMAARLAAEYFAAQEETPTFLTTVVNGAAAARGGAGAGAGDA
jgi:hypothetical protein